MSLNLKKIYLLIRSFFNKHQDPTNNESQIIWIAKLLLIPKPVSPKQNPKMLL